MRSNGLAGDMMPNGDEPFLLWLSHTALEEPLEDDDNNEDLEEDRRPPLKCE